MIAVKEALAIIEQHKGSFGSEVIPFEQSVGRILDEDVMADRDFPPFNRAAMDGIAISMSDWEKGMRSFPVSGEQFAGAPQQELTHGTCLEIMTGAVVPKEADVVIRYEDITIENGKASVNIEEVSQGQNIHPQGVDSEAGTILIPVGKQLTIGDVGILTSVGKVEVKVRRLPKAALISTGDELVEPHETPLPHQIRKSNIHTLATLLKKAGIDFTIFHINDSKEEITREIGEILKSYDLILMSGGVSKGKRDYIPEVLEELGVKKHFHRVMQRPGKPLWFGSNESTTVFGFPGNPVSTLACFMVYCRYWLQSSLEMKVQNQHAKLGREIRFEKELTFFASVSVKNELGELIATPIKGNGSGDLVSLSLADGFIELPAEKSIFKEGEVYPIYLF
ncbi:molybdopterin molybdochelatase [Ekhidna lutea]|uniref:Molybdopterin molybdenumtransferase n=1 Tax=Ekhidna lutea TaxID=447679 RepID=A0A239MBF4_EKHLU|nr:molybdopterin molybdotransferase MoeA [Ekhidna lutea]SNT39492.1 molybdopterin molybdochelatase [Ekhidna lutea]